MKKICLIYTGYLRTWNLCLPNHLDNIWFKGIDAYFYTYEDPMHEIIARLGGIDFPKWIQCPHPFYDNPFADHRFNERKRPESSVYQTFNQWHNNLVAFSLVPKGFDIYVRIRPDMKFNGRLNWNDFENIEKNTIYIPEGQNFCGINDQFAFGDYDTMRKYYSVYLHATDLWNEGHEFNSEIFQLGNLQKQQVNIVRFGSPQHDLIR